ncbi:MAG TPA: oxygenase MpaB family protein [Nocardioidaceae bacterium]|nr:oxygenase MpaB family protein [Nocardioidaceae bacterium]
MTSPVVQEVRSRLGERLFARVAGPEGPARRARIHGTPGPRWFPEGAAIRRVHGDASMFVGGVRALLMQSLHPLAMAGVAAHSGYKGDPWGRLQRTSFFLAVTTFGPTDDAEEMVARVRAVHARVKGTASDGRPYAASDPHLLRWVHIAEIDSFLAAHQRYGQRPLDAAGRDNYVAETARVAEALGATDPPRSEAELREQLAAYRPELAGTPAARQAARYILLTPPLPPLARPPYTAISAAAVAMMPRWARVQLMLPWFPPVDVVVARPAGAAITRTIRWAMAAPG